MTTPDDTSEHVMRARANKAGRLAILLEQHGASPADVRVLPPVGRRIAEVLAGVPVSSDATWELVAQFVGARATVPADPFGPFPVYGGERS